MKLSSDIKTIFQENDEGKVVFEHFLKRISSKSFGVLLVIFSLPIAAPFTPPGFSIPFSLLIIIIGLQMIIKREYVWFPRWILNKNIPGGGNSKFMSWMVKTLEFSERFLRPRLGLLTKSVSYRSLGILVAITGAAIALPVPVLNTILALGVFLIGMALLEEDGVVALIGVAFSLAGLVVVGIATWILITLGTEGLDAFIQPVRDFFSNLI